MYCGNNKTARTSQKNIACALLELLEDGELSARWKEIKDHEG